MHWRISILSGLSFLDSTMVLQTLEINSHDYTQLCTLTLCILGNSCPQFGKCCKLGTLSGLTRHRSLIEWVSLYDSLLMWSVVYSIEGSSTTFNLPRCSAIVPLRSLAGRWAPRLQFIQTTMSTAARAPTTPFPRPCILLLLWRSTDACCQDWGHCMLPCNKRVKSLRILSRLAALTLRHVYRREHECLL